MKQSFHFWFVIHIVREVVTFSKMVVFDGIQDLTQNESQQL